MGLFSRVRMLASRCSLTCSGGLRDEFGNAPLREDFAAGGFAADQLAKERHYHEFGCIRLEEDVQLSVGAFQVAGKAEQFGEEQALAAVGGVGADLVDGRGDGVDQFSGFKGVGRGGHGCLSDQLSVISDQ